MKRFGLFLMLGICLSACQLGSVDQAPTAIVTPLGLTHTPIPQSTDTTTVTQTSRLSSTNTPAIEAAAPFTPSPAKTPTTYYPIAQCPTGTSDLKFDRSKFWELANNGESPNVQFTKSILDFLNSGGLPQSILSALDTNRNRDQIIQIEDITRDAVPEVIIAWGIWVDIFNCRNGQYQLLATMTTAEAEAGSAIIAVTDINSNGQKELVSWFSGCMGSRCPSIMVSEWDGTQFRDLILDRSRDQGCSSVLAPFDVEVRDIDQNGMKEIILLSTGRAWPDDLGFPYRQETRTCVWNGQGVVLDKIEFGPPYYRYQAVQDGDQAFGFGNYTRALDFYQQAIFSDKLEWFTQERRNYDFWAYHSDYFPSGDEPTPTLAPSLVPDPNEYPNLAAYARYRIMLLYIKQGWLSDAQVVLDTLERKYPAGNTGNAFAQMASGFWREYQASQNLRLACNQAIAYAATRLELLSYLGSTDHGEQSIDYKPDDTCPFR